MNDINNYKDLLLEEDRLIREIAISRINIEENIKSYLSPKHLFSFFEDKLEEKINQDFSGEFELKKYLISLSLDFLYEKMTETLLKSSDDKNNSIDWKIVAKSIVDRFYINNKPYVTDIVSVYVDKGIKKWTNR
ncbi:MAG TPA: hypothetical protein VKY37_06585 [Brumimicrobium sp.]|nr:hypothetical protein [Brumimicrobium sp.]